MLLQVPRPLLLLLPLSKVQTIQRPSLRCLLMLALMLLQVPRPLLLLLLLTSRVP
jgi:hypothetical protein